MPVCVCVCVHLHVSVARLFLSQSSSCSRDAPLSCVVGEMSGRQGLLSLRQREVYTDPVLQLTGDHTGTAERARGGERWGPALKQNTLTTANLEKEPQDKYSADPPPSHP